MWIVEIVIAVWYLICVRTAFLAHRYTFSGRDLHDTVPAQCPGTRISLRQIKHTMQDLNVYIMTWSIRVNN